MSNHPPKWTKSSKTFVFIFNVGRGLSAFIRLPNNTGVIYDMGNDAETEPSQILKDNLFGHIRAIKQLVVSHPHKDHYSGSSEMMEMLKAERMTPALVTMPNFVERDASDDEVKDECLNEDLLTSMSDDDKERYKSIYGDRTPPLQVMQKDGSMASAQRKFECALFYVRPPEVEELHSSGQEYANGTSLCYYLRHNNHAIFFAGDITPAAMKELINATDKTEKRYSCLSPSNSTEYPESAHDKNAKNPNLADLLSNENISLINVAPHHGLESCYCDEFFQTARPLVNIVSEKSGEDSTVDKRYSTVIENGVYVKSGVPATQDRGEKRKMLTTRKDGHILIIMGHESSAPVFYHSKNVSDLFAVLNDLS